ncbi:MAG: hypothetical protein ABIX01_24170 [Chitinophagaceae bacterium]
MKRQLHHIILAFSTILLCSIQSEAQPIVKATVNTTAIRIGEPIIVKLTATWPGNPGFTNGFVIPDSIPHFETWEKTNAVIVKDGIEQILTVTSYDSGRFAIPSFSISTPNIEKPGPGYSTDSILINVSPVNVDTLKEYHEIKDIIEVSPNPQWPYILAIAGITLIAGIGLYFLLKKLGIGKKPARRNSENTMHPYQAAVQALGKLEKDISTTASNPFFTQLTHIYRNYLSDAHNFRSHQQTGDELILQAKPLLSQELFFQFANTIRLSDAAKFAKYDPPKGEWNASIKTIGQALEAMEKTKQVSP